MIEDVRKSARHVGVPIASRADAEPRMNREHERTWVVARAAMMWQDEDVRGQIAGRDQVCLGLFHDVAAEQDPITLVRQPKNDRTVVGVRDHDFAGGRWPEDVDGHVTAVGKRDPAVDLAYRYPHAPHVAQHSMGGIPR